MGRNNQLESEFKTFDLNLLTKAYRTYFTQRGLKNIFQLLEELNNPIVQPWITKSKHELNRFTQYILCINTFNKTKPGYNTCQAIHESLNNCSVSIVFSLFNIFAAITKTQASFFDQSIRDYFMERVKLKFEESYQLSFYWHEPVLSMNSLGYSAEEYLKIYSYENGISFSVVTRKDNSELENEEITSSLQFYTFHLFQLLSTIDLVAKLLNPGTTQNKTTSFLQIENYHDLYNIYEDILKEIETAT